MPVQATRNVFVLYNKRGFNINMTNTPRLSRRSVLNEVATIGLDLAKNSVFFVGLDASGQVRTRRQYSKTKLLAVTSALSPCRIGMEACCGAHHLGRALLAQGHDTRLMPPKYVKPFVKRDKNDSKDAEACLRPTMRFVAVKSEQQLSMQSVHRHRSRLVANSTQLVNQARAFLLERGIAVPQGKHKFAARLPEILEDADNGLPDVMRELLADMLAEWRELECRIAEINRCLRAEAQANEACRRLMEVPGIGPQTSTALVAAIDAGRAFEKGRDFAAWLGLTPRETSTGGKQRLGGISKRGNKYLRTLLVHGARSALETLSKRRDRLGALSSWTSLRYRFDNWSDGVAIEASPPSGDGMYAAGTQVTLTAAPEHGGYLAGWTGDASGRDSVQTVAMDAARSVEAIFTRSQPLVPGEAKEVSLAASSQYRLYSGGEGCNVLVPPDAAKLAVAFESSIVGAEVDLYVRRGLEVRADDREAGTKPSIVADH